MFVDTKHWKLRMRNHQEDIPPWKKEVLMRRDGLSKAVENDTSLLNLEDSIPTPTHQLNGIKQNRYRIGSSSSFMSKVKISEIEDAPAEGSGRQINLTHPYTEMKYCLAIFHFEGKYFLDYIRASIFMYQVSILSRPLNRYTF